MPRLDITAKFWIQGLPLERSLHISAFPSTVKMFQHIAVLLRHGSAHIIVVEDSPEIMALIDRARL